MSKPRSDGGRDRRDRRRSRDRSRSRERQRLVSYSWAAAQGWNGILLFLSAGPGPGPGLEEDAIGPTLETETARGDVRGTRRTDRPGVRGENIDIHRIEVQQLSVLAWHILYMFCTQINGFFLSETISGSICKNWINILLQE